MNTKIGINPRILLGAVLVLVGGTIFLDNLGIIQFSAFEMIFSVPGIMFIIGLFLVINSRRTIFGGSLMAVGVFLGILRVYNFHYGIEIMFPIVMIFLGLNIIFKKRNFKVPGETYFKQNRKVYNEDQLEDVSIFGGGVKTFNSDNFQGGSVTAIFGGSEIDLSSCKLAPGEQVIDLVVLFGGVEIIVPYDWKIQVEVTPLFGGFSNKYKRDPKMILNQDGILRIKGTVVFGGGEIKFR